jgi:hypothetical protein
MKLSPWVLRFELETLKMQFRNLEMENIDSKIF